MTKKVRGLIKFVFDYPFDLGILTGRYYPVIFSKKDIALVKVNRREGIQSFDKRYVQREKIGESPFLEKLQFSEKIASTKFVLKNGGVTQAVAGEGGYVIYPWFFSEIEIVFVVDDIFCLHNDNECDKALDRMYSFFNKFLSAYRQVGSVRNRFLSADDDFSLYTLCYISEFTENEQKNPAESLLKILKEKREFTPYPMQGDKSEKDDIPLCRGRYASVSKTDVKELTIDSSKYESFLKYLSGPEIRPYRKILLSGLERISLNYDYQAAIIDFDTAVDMAVSFHLRKFLKDNGKNDQEITDLFEDYKSEYSTTNKRVAQLEKSLLANKLATNEEGFLKESNECKSWRDIARKRRNDVAHSGKEFNRKEVEESFQISQKFIIFMESLCN
ncbi:MAG: hypothetical protein ACD_15C00066G0019 [uncultured bacterium]|nr:MAG: hypothetical protein ACD_15C00066G0019 [uncultured bacterium]